MALIKINSLNKEGARNGSNLPERGVLNSKPKCKEILFKNLLLRVHPKK